jgi:hypothetical protein
MRRKIFTPRRLVAVAALATAGALVAMGASAATHSNGVSSFTHYTTSGATATAGYFTSPLGATDVFTHIEGFLGSGGTTSLENLGTGADNGQGLGLCGQGTGNAVRMGIGNVDASNNTKSIILAYGNLGTADSFGDPCANGASNSGSPGTLNSPVVLAAGIPVGDTIDGQILAHSGFGAAGCNPFQVAFEWQDLTANPGVWNLTCESVGFKPIFNEADAGVIGDTQGMAPPASLRLADFAHLGLTELLGSGHGVHGSFQANANWEAFPVDASTNGTSSGSVLLAASPFANDGMGVKSGTPVS